MARRHGNRKGIARNCDCRAKSACFTTYEAAYSAVSRVPDAERAYRGDCCGHYHITRSTEDEYAQRVAEFSGVDLIPVPVSPGSIMRQIAESGRRTA